MPAHNQRLGSRWAVLAGLALGGCVSTPPEQEVAHQDLPLLQTFATERVTELLDASRVGAEIVAVGDGAIIRSNDCGETWQKAEVKAPTMLSGVSFAPDGQHGWAVGHQALILATTDGGQTWEPQWQGENRAQWFLDVCALDEQHVIAVGTDGLCEETTDAGATWLPRKPVAGNIRWNRLSRGPTGTLYLAGEHGVMARSEDQGLTWVRLSSPDSSTFYGVLPLGAHTLLAYGGNIAGIIFRSDDDGRSWSGTVISRSLIFATILQLHDGTILLAGIGSYWRTPDLGSYFISRDGGRSFTPWRLTPSNLGIIELVEAPNGALLAFGKEGVTILRSK